MFTKSIYFLLCPLNLSSLLTIHLCGLLPLIIVFCLGFFSTHRFFFSLAFVSILNFIPQLLATSSFFVFTFYVSPGNLCNSKCIIPGDCKLRSWENRIPVWIKINQCTNCVNLLKSHFQTELRIGQYAVQLVSWEISLWVKLLKIVGWCEIRQMSQMHAWFPSSRAE